MNFVLYFHLGVVAKRKVSKSIGSQTAHAAPMRAYLLLVVVLTCLNNLFGSTVDVRGEFELGGSVFESRRGHVVMFEMWFVQLCFV